MTDSSLVERLEAGPGPTEDWPLEALMREAAQALRERDRELRTSEQVLVAAGQRIAELEADVDFWKKAANLLPQVLSKES